MNPKILIPQFFEKIWSYNIYVDDEAEDDNNDGQVTDQAKVIKHQRYATRLYLGLFIVSFYVLIMATLINPQSRLVTISHVTPSIIDQLRLEHGETLSCPCSTISIPYKDFVSHTISFDPVCTSVFTSQQWIEALYTPGFLTRDFRQTASSQVS
ncbi:unnamed protein product [Adineta steineri]|uniref:Uncharacterized protein n=1 Tax=Adineta steineri TaxID=433720 RepID=A0A819DNK5_9BILA|nr:unnamed protein product [Adineta steineri]CAF3838965.1 unnamed protein product [Adineta steineri]